MASCDIRHRVPCLSRWCLRHRWARLSCRVWPSRAPVGGVVDVAARGAASAAGESAGAVAGAEVAGEVGGDPVGGATVGQEGAGLGVGEDALERRGVRGEPASGVGVDRAVAVEFGGLVGVPEQGEHGHGDEHSRHDRANHPRSVSPSRSVRTPARRRSAAASSTRCARVRWSTIGAVSARARR